MSCRTWVRRSSPLSPSLRFESLEERLPLTAGPMVIDFEVGSTQWNSQYADYLTDNSLGSHGYRLPVGSTSQLKSLPWTNIDQLIVKFNEDVDVLASHLSLTGVNATNFQIQHFSYDPRTFTATWTLSAALAKNSYLLKIDGDGLSPVKSRSGQALDGEWTTSSDVYPSGNGGAGGDFAFSFRVLPGDVNQNNSVEYYDYYASTSKNGLTTTSTGFSPLIDVNGSGSHTSADSTEIMSRLWNSYPSGSPVGAANDAPSTRGGGYHHLNVNAVDLAIDLWDDFADAETADSQLNYQILSTSNSSLWASKSINASTGQLVVVPATNAIGRSIVTVRATDSTGQFIDSKYVIDLGRVNAAPSLVYTITSTSLDNFRVAGMVTDDGLLEGLMVEFSGAVGGRAWVAADGSFEFTVIAGWEDWGEAVGIVHDYEGEISNEYEQLLALY